VNSYLPSAIRQQERQNLEMEDCAEEQEDCGGTGEDADETEGQDIRFKVVEEAIDLRHCYDGLRLEDIFMGWCVSLGCL